MLPCAPIFPLNPTYTFISIVSAISFSTVILLQFKMIVIWLFEVGVGVWSNPIRHQTYGTSSHLPVSHPQCDLKWQGHDEVLLLKLQVEHLCVFGDGNNNNMFLIKMTWYKNKYQIFGNTWSKSNTFFRIMVQQITPGYFSKWLCGIQIIIISKCHKIHFEQICSAQPSTSK